MNRLCLSFSTLLTGFAAFAVAAMQATPAPQVPPDKVYFTANGTGFAFLRPKAWKEVDSKREKEQKLYIPTAPGHPDAIMHFYPIAYRLSAADFQQDQIVAAPDLKRSVERQWQEEIIGVPLLLTKTTGLTKKGVPDVALTGMLYSATVNKMLFRLTCDAADFDIANAAWRSAFETLRTTDGLPVKPEDPNHKPTKEELEGRPSAPLPVTILEPSRKSIKFVEGPVRVPGKAGGKNASIRLPKGWSAKTQADGSWILTGTDLAFPITMSLASTLDSDPPKSALFKLGDTSLNIFNVVNDREESDDVTNLAGGVTNTIWRYGTSAKGALTTCDASITSGDLYILLHFKADAVLTAPQRRAVNELLSETTIDLLP